ncbi:hypothetical protein RI367_006096 [Sorochytrium milnesiophthora]
MRIHRKWDTGACKNVAGFAKLAALKNLQKLHVFQDITGSNFTSQGIPVEIGQLTVLQTLKLGSSGLTGMADALQKLVNLVTLDLSDNAFRTAVPPWIGALKQLQDLALARSIFTGNLPAGLWKLKNLQSLDLSGNYEITGSIPSDIQKLTSLLTLEAANNKLSGSIPAELYQLTQINSIDFVGNQLTGTLSPAIGNLKNLTSFMIDGNNITGTLPAALGNLGITTCELGSAFTCKEAGFSTANACGSSATVDQLPVCNGASSTANGPGGQPASAPSATSSSGLVAGIAIGAAIILLAVAAFVVYRRARARRVAAAAKQASMSEVLVLDTQSRQPTLEYLPPGQSAEPLYLPTEPGTPAYKDTLDGTTLADGRALDSKN